MQPEAPAPSLPQPVSRWRWGIHFVILALYPLALGASSYFVPEDREAPMLPTDSGSLVLMIGLQFGLFVFVFGLAWLASRATSQELLLGWRGGIAPVWRGFLYSIGLRLLIAAAVLMVVLVAMWLGGGWDEASIEKFRPKVENLIDSEALASDPIYLVLNLTLVSFVFAGFREELWRAALMAGVAALFPRLSASLWGKFGMVGIAAIIFGLGHLPQGWSGVAITMVLGLGLGAIIVVHRSIWDAVLAHGFFDATTFLLLYLLPKLIPDFKLTG